MFGGAEIDEIDARAALTFHPHKPHPHKPDAVNMVTSQRPAGRPHREYCGPGPKEGLMPEKSPQKPAGKKPGKSLKEKREAKREKKDSRSGLGR
jgi:hypothetical protein